MPSLFVVQKINVDPIVEYGITPNSLNITQTLKARSTCNFSVPDPLQNITFESGMNIVVLDENLARVFGGTIESAERRIRTGTNPPYRIWDIKCTDYNHLADKILVGERTWENQTIGQIVRDIVEMALPNEGINTGGIGVGPVIPEFTTFYGTCADAFTELSKLASAFMSTSGAGGGGSEFGGDEFGGAEFALLSGSMAVWQWNIDYYKTLYFFLPEAAEFVTPLVGADFKADTLRLKQTREQYVNKVTATFNGEVVIAKNDAEIAARAAVEGGTGVYEKAFHLSDREVISDLTQYAESRLNALKYMSLVLTGETRRTDLRIGGLVTLNAAGYGDTTTKYLIKSIRIRDEQATILWRSIECIYGPETQDYAEWFHDLRKNSSSTAAADEGGVIAYA
jgi:hypothetical protein